MRALALLVALAGCSGATSRAAPGVTYVTASVTLTCDRNGCSIAPAVEVTREVAP